VSVYDIGTFEYMCNGCVCGCRQYMMCSVFLECSVCTVRVCGVALLIFLFYRSRILLYNTIIIIKTIHLNSLSDLKQRKEANQNGKEI
jgi:hypothetical protein